MLLRVYRWLLARPHVALLAAIGILGVIEVAAIGDYNVSDPMWYAQIAHDRATGKLATLSTHPFEMRVGLTYPLSLLYRAFGAAPLITTLPNLIAGLGIVLVAYAGAPTPRSKLLALLFALGSFALVQHAVVLGVDFTCGALIGGSVLCLARRDRHRGWIVGALTLWFAAFLIKETALWCLPLWIYVLWTDRATLARYLPALLVGAALAAGYLALCAVYWGSPFARFAGIQDLSGAHRWSMNDEPAAAWIRRLLWGPPALFLRVFHGTLVFAVIAAVRVRGRDALWWIASATLLGMYWFSSTSVTTYEPLPLVPRMASYALPTLLVAAALGADHVIERFGRRAAIVVALAALLPGVVMTSKFVARPRPETAALALLFERAQHERVIVVCGDPRCPALVAFHAGFAIPAQLEVQFAPQFANAPAPVDRSVFALVNLGRPRNADWFDPASDPRGYRVEKITQLGLPALVEERGVRLYAAGDGAALWRALQ